MIQLELRLVGTIRLGMQRYKGAIRCIRGGKTSDYSVQLGGPNDETVGEGFLYEHPRWSEPMSGLLARCIAVAEPAQTMPLEPWRLATLVVHIRSRFLMEIQATSQDIPEPELNRSLIDAPPAVKSAWQLIRWRLAQDAWGQTEPPRLPARLQVPVHRDGRVRFCRTSDLPPEARSQFEEWRFGREAPTVSQDDAAFPDDIDAYFGSGTCRESPPRMDAREAGDVALHAQAQRLESVLKRLRELTAPHSIERATLVARLEKLLPDD